jgi:hypothetical protein
MDEAMKTHAFARSRNIAALSLTVVGALAAGTWWYGQQSQEPAVHAPQGWSASQPGPVERSEPAATTPAPSPVTEMTLRLDGANRLVEHEPAPSRKTAKPAPAAKSVDAQTSDAFVENDPNETLDLNVQNAFDAPDHAARAQAAAATTRTRPNPLDVSQFQKQAPEVESYNLFKSEYGLRGFMKQNWINQRVALLGGLGLNDDRLIENEDDDFRDDIAFGMGLIVAF